MILIKIVLKVFSTNSKTKVSIQWNASNSAIKELRSGPW